MNILWVQKAETSGQGGDEVYNRKLLEHLSKTHEIDEFTVPELSTRFKIANLMRGLPHNRISFDLADTVKLLRARILTGSYDAVIVSWEQLDTLAWKLGQPIILILHNIAGNAMREIYPWNPIAKIAAMQANFWERHIYRSQQIAAIGVLSIRDYCWVRKCVPGKAVALIPPGVPPLAELAPDAIVRRELLLSGSYDWSAKRRDIIAFARAYAGIPARARVFHDQALPPVVESLLASRVIVPSQLAEAIRFGVIADTFSSGYKLKTMYYAANNCLTLTFADVEADFTAIPGHEFFIRRIRSVAEIESIMAEVERLDPIMLRAKLTEFKRHCAEIFSWSAAADSLSALVDQVTFDARVGRK